MKFTIFLLVASVSRSLAQDPNVFCTTQPSGNYPLAGSNCMQFIVCAGGKGTTSTCEGTTLFNPTTEVCEVGYVCLEQTTAAAVPTTTIPTTAIPTAITTTQAAITTPADVNVFCSTKAMSNYPYGTGCTQYIKCYPYGGVMRGAVYTCMGTTLFNPSFAYCQDGYPCTT